MLVPIKPLDFELSGQPAADLPVPRGYRAARVLVRWRGVPVGTVHAPVVGDRVRVADIVPAITRRLGPNLGPEIAARALRSGRGGKPLRFEDAPLQQRRHQFIDRGLGAADAAGNIVRTQRLADFLEEIEDIERPIQSSGPAFDGVFGHVFDS